MDRMPYHEHDCARCVHRRAFGLDYIDDLELGCLATRTSPEYRRSPLLSWTPASSTTDDSIPLERNTLILEQLGHRIIEAYLNLEAADREVRDLGRELNERRGARSRFREAQLDYLAEEASPRVDIGERVEWMVAERQTMMPGIRHTQESLREAMEEGETLQNELHQLRLRRGCTCCNPALRQFNLGSEIMSTQIRHSEEDERLDW